MKNIDNQLSISKVDKNTDAVKMYVVREEIIPDGSEEKTIEYKYELSFRCKRDLSTNLAWTFEDVLVKTNAIDATVLYSKLIEQLEDPKLLNTITIEITKTMDNLKNYSCAFYLKGRLETVELVDSISDENWKKWYITREGYWEFTRRNYSTRWNFGKIEYRVKVKPENVHLVASTLEENIKCCLSTVEKLKKMYFGAN